MTTTNIFKGYADTVTRLLRVTNEFSAMTHDENYPGNGKSLYSDQSFIFILSSHVLKLAEYVENNETHDGEVFYEMLSKTNPICEKAEQEITKYQAWKLQQESDELTVDELASKCYAESKADKVIQDNKLEYEKDKDDAAIAAIAARLIPDAIKRKREVRSFSLNADDYRYIGITCYSQARAVHEGGKEALATTPPPPLDSEQ